MYTGIAIHTTLTNVSTIGVILCVDSMKNLHMYNKASDLITWRWFGPDRSTHALMHVGQSYTMKNV